MDAKPPIINCHTHIFTGDNVPPYLAKTFIPSPLHYLFPLSLVVGLFRFWYKHPYAWQYKPWYKSLKETIFEIRISCSRIGIARAISFIIGLILTIHAFFIINDWITGLVDLTTASENVEEFKQWLSKYTLIFIPESFIVKLLVIAILLFFFKTGRNILFFALKKVWTFLGILPGPQTKELAKRYLNIGRFALYRDQSGVFTRLKNQYPAGTGFVVLPMDMEYMGAGKLMKGFQYAEQMKALNDIKQNTKNKDVFFPFVFVDPRRINKEKGQLNYKINNGKVTLENCFIKEYIEEHRFNGFKIYPALGYYPFDEALLPLWKYAADNSLPIMTHCIRGTIYYRGNKKKEWDKHPVIEQVCGKNDYEPLLLTQVKNVDFCNNFTHPLNYLCLLDERLLRKVVKNAKDERIRDLFGYTDDITTLKHNLSHLKLCFGHFGGDEEWNRFLESDRDNYSVQLVKNPMQGITFLEDANGKPTPGKLEQVWKFVDWYSIICSMMLQYNNVYADLSYIIHNSGIQPLLKYTLSNDILKERVLFGTDFYVVRNHKSEKNMLIDILDQMNEQELDQIGRINPKTFLNNCLPLMKK